MIFSLDDHRTHCYEQIIVSKGSNVHDVSIDEITPNVVHRVNTDSIKTASIEVYGVNTCADDIETTPNEVYGVSTDGTETVTNEL